MLRKISLKCSNVFLNSNVIFNNQYDVFVYGLELFISTGLCIISVLGISVWLNMGWLGALFLICFMPIRTLVGGYHASTYGKCFMITNTIAIINIIVCSWLDKLCLPNTIDFFILFCLFIYIILQTPVNSYSKVLKIMAFEIILYELFSYKQYNDLRYIIISTTATVSIMLLIIKEGGK